MNVFAENGAILLSEINVLKEAMSGFDSAGFDEEPAGQAALIDDYDFARLDLAYEFCADGIERASFACGGVNACVGLAQA